MFALFMLILPAFGQSPASPQTAYQEMTSALRCGIILDYMGLGKELATYRKDAARLLSELRTAQAQLNPQGEVLVTLYENLERRPFLTNEPPGLTRANIVYTKRLKRVLARYSSNVSPHQIEVAKQIHSFERELKQVSAEILMLEHEAPVNGINIIRHLETELDAAGVVYVEFDPNNPQPCSN